MKYIRFISLLFACPFFTVLEGSYVKPAIHQVTPQTVSTYIADQPYSHRYITIQPGQPVFAIWGDNLHHVQLVNQIAGTIAAQKESVTAEEINRRLDHTSFMVKTSNHEAPASMEIPSNIFLVCEQADKKTESAQPNNTKQREPNYTIPQQETPSVTLPYSGMSTNERMLNSMQSMRQQRDQHAQHLDAIISKIQQKAFESIHEDFTTYQATHQGHNQSVFSNVNSINLPERYNNIGAALARADFYRLLQLSDSKFLRAYYHMIVDQSHPFFSSRNSAYISTLKSLLNNNRQLLDKKIIDMHESTFRSGRLAVLPNVIKALFVQNLSEKELKDLQHYYHAIKDANADTSLITNCNNHAFEPNAYQRLSNIVQRAQNNQIYAIHLGQASIKQAINTITKWDAYLSRVTARVQHATSDILPFYKDAILHGLHTSAIPLLDQAYINPQFFVQHFDMEQQRDVQANILKLTNNLGELTEHTSSTENPAVKPTLITIESAMDACKQGHIEIAQNLVAIGSTFIRFGSHFCSSVTDSVRDTCNIFLHPIRTAQDIGQSVSTLAKEFIKFMLLAEEINENQKTTLALIFTHDFKKATEHEQQWVADIHKKGEKYTQKLEDAILAAQIAFNKSRKTQRRILVPSLGACLVTFLFHLLY